MRSVSSSGSNFAAFLGRSDREVSRGVGDDDSFYRRVSEIFHRPGMKEVVDAASDPYQDILEGSLRYQAIVRLLGRYAALECVSKEKFEEAEDNKDFGDALSVTSRDIEDKLRAIETLEEISHLLPQEKKIILDLKLFRLAKEHRQEISQREGSKREECSKRFCVEVHKIWQEMFLKAQKNRPEDEDISQFQKAFFEKLQKEDENTAWKEMMKLAGTLPKDERDIKMMEFFLQCTQEEKKSGLGLLWWPEAKGDLKRLYNLIVKTDDILKEKDEILQKKTEIEALSDFRTFKEQLSLLGSEEREPKNLQKLCGEAGFSSKRKKNVCDFAKICELSEFTSQGLWKDKNASSLEMALDDLKKVIEVRGKPQRREGPMTLSVEQGSTPVPLASTPTREGTHEKERTTDLTMDLLDKYGEKFGLGSAGYLSKEKKFETLKERIFEPVGKKLSEEFTNSFKWLENNKRIPFFNFTRNFLLLKEGDLYDDAVKHIEYYSLVRDLSLDKKPRR